MKTPTWFIATLARVPTNFTTPFKVAVEANDAEHATRRLYDLFDDNYAGLGCNKSEAIYEPAKERLADLLVSARKFPLHNNKKGN